MKVIRSFGSKDTEKIWNEQYVKGVDRDLQRAALRKLEILHAARDVEDLRVPPGNRLEKLSGDRKGQRGASASNGEREEPRMSNSSTITDAGLIEPIHPGEVLMQDFIEGFGITQNRLAVAIGVPPRRINEIVHGKRGISADTAIRLARYFGTSEEFWMNLQSHYELRVERRALQQTLESITPLQVA